MALPTVEKTWQYNVNQAMGSGASLGAACADLMYKIKASLITFATLPWTVWGSNDGAGNFGNGDSVDRWASSANVNWGAIGANHSWIVLGQSGLSTKAAICIDLNNVNQYNATLVLSPSAGFGLTNGGTNGTATARPTASDEIVISSVALWGAYQFGAFTGRLHVMQSNDGQCTRVISCYNSNPIGMWIFDRAKGPVTAWTTPVFGSRVAEAQNNSLTWAKLSPSTTTSGSLFRIGSSNGYLWFTCEYNINTRLISVLTVADDDTSDWPLFPIGLLQQYYPHRGRKGDVYDMWWASDGTATADTYPGDASKQFAQFGSIVIPWDGSTPLIT